MTSHEPPGPDSQCTIGAHRPVYLWAGPGTVRMNRLKFMDAPVDEAVHAEAHTPDGAQRMAHEAAFTWAYLAYNWGFPPETEWVDWEDFRRAVSVYHAAGMRVFGYVQTSNCVHAGSFRGKDWYALDPKGHRFYYYTGRYMTCWTHPGWLEHLRGIVGGIVEAGADGVFFDNPWHGIQPLHLGGTWMGQAGCYCHRCRAAFRQATGLEMPEQICPETDETSRRYVRWRAGQVTKTLDMLASYARSLDPDVLISANDFDAVMRPSHLVYGIDLRALAEIQDLIMIEDYGLPCWKGAPGDAAVLANNALTLRTARVLVGDTPLSTDPYDKGIGFDPVYPARRFRQGIAEAAACGATMVVKGTEYVEDGAFTLLTAERFAPQRQAIGRSHRWLASHASLYQHRQNAAQVGLLYPGDALWQNWDRLAPPYFGAGQTLLAEGIPWRVVTLEGDSPPDQALPGSEASKGSRGIAGSSGSGRLGLDLPGLDLLLCFDGVPPEDVRPPGLRVISVPDLPGWAPPGPAFLTRHRRVRSAISSAVNWLFQSYFRWRWSRQLVDRLGLVHFFWQTPFFRLPPLPAREALLAALGERPFPRVMAGAPVLAELWQQGEEWLLHLVNYAAEPQPVTVEFGRLVHGRGLSPDSQEGGAASSQFRGTSYEIRLDVYTVLQYWPETAGEYSGDSVGQDL
jgi:hypothetical protein